jgi:hypothetical protein
MNDYLPIHNQVPSWVDNDRRWADAILEAEMGIPSKGPQWVQGARDFGLLPKTPERAAPGMPATANVRDDMVQGSSNVDRLLHPDEYADPQHGLHGGDLRPATSPKSMFGGSPPML